MKMRNADKGRAHESFRSEGRNAGILMPKGKYERMKCEARAALDQPCQARAVVRVDSAPLCHYHARQAFDAAHSFVERLDIARG